MTIPELVIGSKIYLSKLLSVNFLQMFVTALVLILTTHQVMIACLLCLMVIDSITGAWKAKKAGRKISWSKIGLNYLLQKAFAYFFILAVGVFCDTAIKTIYVTYAFLSAMIFREAASNVENIDEILGTNFLSILKNLFKKKTTPENTDTKIE